MLTDTCNYLSNTTANLYTLITNSNVIDWIHTHPVITLAAAGLTSYLLYTKISNWRQYTKLKQQLKNVKYAIQRRLKHGSHRTKSNLPDSDDVLQIKRHVDKQKKHNLPM